MFVNSGVSLYSGFVRARRLLIVGVAVSLLGFSTAGSASACSCVEATPREALRQADAAIVGRLVEVVPRDRYSSDYRYLVRGIYKRGEGIRRGGIVSVRSGLNGAACGLPSSEGRRYGLFLSRSDGGWIGSSCRLVGPAELVAAAAGAQRNRDLSASAATISCAS